ncbi:hypothetical protein LX99_05006 [Mucilaginibacter oryzae]|uniref:Lipoprotein n=1 Tax=Mucilaginibacter oryzae TaxID=468058 RepID=A0A316GT84_9SPHI|nr:hypothetical protein [Mucilaginibacter oryzae]PWK65773.1 hypothetical protein LX99_05006 [Mucilaginibacter oryzae]
MKTLKCQFAGLVLLTGLLSAAVSSCEKEENPPKPAIHNVGRELNVADTTGHGLSGGEDGVKFPPK